MANTLRSFVSGDKRRYTADGYNLDLTYITPRLIAMGLPGKGVSALWRNRVEEVASFLDKNHSGHYRIFSLGKSAGDFFRLRNNTSWFGWSAKKSPPLELLNRILHAINDWLSMDPLNVAVIHCKEGRERSGVVIASYLVKSGAFPTPKEALDYYASMRSKYQEGVQTPSQIRYVHYISSVIQLPEPKKIYLRKITLRPVPDYSTFNPVIEILNSGVVPAQSLLTLKDYRPFQKLDFAVPLEMSFPIQGDTYIHIFNRLNILGLTKTNLLMFRIGFHTSFVPHRWVLTKSDLDGELAGPVQDGKLRKNFTVEFLFTDGPFDPLPVDPALIVPQTQAQPQQPQVQVQPQVQPQQTNLYPNPYPQYNQYTYPLATANLQYDQLPNSMPHSMPYTPIQSARSIEEEPIGVIPPPVMNGSEYLPQPSMSWYHPSETAHVTSSVSAPPPINRDTKDNRQKLTDASDAVARATQLLRTMGAMTKANSSEKLNDQPAMLNQI